MRTRTARTLLFTAAALLATAAVGRAQTLDVKLGLWEVTTSLDTAGLPAIDTSQMNLTPEQKARMEALLHGRQGMTQSPHVSRECLTKEKLDNALFKSRAESDPSCKRTVVTSTARVQEMKIECTDHKASGEMRIEALSPENVKMNGKMTGGDAGHSLTMNWAATAKWLSADCGGLK